MIRMIKEIIDTNLKRIENDLLEIKDILNIDFIDIFPTSNEHKELLDTEALSIGKIVKETDRGNVYLLDKGISTKYGYVNLIKVRLFDESRLSYEAAADFVVSNREILLSKVGKDSRFKYIKREEWDAVEFKTDNTLVYFLSPLASEVYLKDYVMFSLDDEDINLDVKDMKNCKVRIAARGIVMDDKGRIALQLKSKKNQYKLIGGGIEDNEDFGVAFKREVLEETGCQVEIIKKLGLVIENRGFLDLKQTSHIFVSRVINDTHILDLTEKEANEGAKLVWLSPKEALEKLRGCYDELLPSEYDILFDTQFDVVRDIKILEYYLDK